MIPDSSHAKSPQADVGVDGLAGNEQVHDLGGALEMRWIRMSRTNCSTGTTRSPRARCDAAVS